MEERKKTANTILIVVVLTFLAKFIGFFREALLGSRIGANMASDAYIMAFYTTISNFISIGTAITIAAIPIIVERLTLKGKEEAFALSNQLLNMICLFALTFISISYFYAEKIMSFLAKGFEEEKLILTINLAKIMLPALLCICITYVFVSLLQSLGIFTITSFISVPANIIAIGFLLLYAERYGVQGLAYVTLVGWILQFVIQIPFLRKAGFRYKLSFNFKDELIKRFFKIIVPITAVASVNQINMLLDEMQASNLHHGKVSALYYAGMLYLSIASIMVYGISAVMFPKFAEKAVKMEKRQYGLFVTSIIKLLIFVLLPMTIGIGLLSKPLIRLIFERGVFDREAAVTTGIALALYAFGMIGYAIQDVINKAFYALQDIKIPVKFSVLMMGLNFLLNVVLSRFYDVAGIAFATTSATTLGAIGLMIAFKGKVGTFGGRRLLKSLIKVVFACLFMAVSVILTGMLMDTYFTGVSLSNKIMRVGIPSFVGILVYAVVTLRMKIEEAEYVFNNFIYPVISKIKRKSLI
ncbi:putative peptidoglycan lipid II flippase [Anaerosolibacter carboniphilus]|uniref:Probable lipid II flippase MurJ n=1 Tax=Anaerosolibacter carboniphilus TaxID=1417629 RepID=A0A841L977_9FIRM|nr:murein biosynthesis integral membrane protein MurJ [Anaerosolibacter carboniphilus]MBB6218805.1 putative peptidoglycan lipid II flippase [Anaerosolibacter carboniphilus]